MHGMPEWLLFVLSHWLAAFIVMALSAIYLVGFVWFAVKWHSLKIALVWPLFLAFYRGPV